MANAPEKPEFGSFRRGSWQYDLIVAAILAFIFLTPRQFFGDQPRPDLIQKVSGPADGSNVEVFWVDKTLIETDSRRRLVQLINKRAGRALRIVEIKPAEDPDGAVRAYLVYAEP